MENLIANCDSIEKLVSFLHFCEKGKYTFRTSVTSLNTKDSIASHSWRMLILALVIYPYLHVKVSLEKVLKLIIIHDLAELEVGDINLIRLLKNPSLAKLQSFKERAFFKTLNTQLPPLIANEFFELWDEFQKNSTYEAKLVNAIDKIEAQLQNNESRSTKFVQELEKIGKMSEIRDYFTFDTFIEKLFNYCLNTDEIKDR